jgi:predicted Rossmann fold nucleotide-binding protein DprA/Smf involved in DNA uptake
MRYGIVGSRKRLDRYIVEAFVHCLPKESVVVSGGCKGIDTWAVDAAIKNGLQTKVFLPLLIDNMSYGEMCEAYYARNRQIVEDCDILIAFVSHDRKGGTEYTVNYALAAGKPVEIK